MNHPGGRPGDETDNPYRPPAAAVEPRPADGQGLRARWLFVEGYAALGLALATFVAPRVDHPSATAQLVALPTFGLVLLFGVSGVRSGRRGGRLAAGLALALEAVMIIF